MELIISASKTKINNIRTNRYKKGKSIIGFPDNYCVVDIETTGTSPRWDNIIEIGAIRYSNGQEVGRFQSLVKPPIRDGAYVDAFIEHLTGITNAMLSTALDTNVVIKRFYDFIGDDILVGYNINFDINFLYDNFIQALNVPLENNFIDVLRLARKLYPNMQHHRLKDMVALFHLTNENEHRAIGDCLVTNECFYKMKAEAILKHSDIDTFIKTFDRKQHKKLNANDIQGDMSKQDPDNPLYGKYCVFTGKLGKMIRSDAMKIVADLGGINENGVTKKTNYLILGEEDYRKKTTKYVKAEQYILKGQDIQIISESVFYDFIDDYLNE